MRDDPAATTSGFMVIHKEGKPPEECASYRPISLLGAEVKILAKVLSTRLNKVITPIIHPDQSGFMPNRNTALNLRRLHGVMTRAHLLGEDALLFSLDARKAFDMVNGTTCLQF